MASALLAFLLLEEDFNTQKIQRKRLRDRSDPLDLPESSFIDQYRLNKDAFIYVLNEIKPHVHSTSIPINLQLAATLRFLAEGSYQRSIGNDYRVSTARSTVSDILSRILPALEAHVCPQWVTLKMSDEEKHNSRDYFYTKYKMAGIIGCIDGTHIKILKPQVDEHLFFNRKGYFSINAMIVCDNNMLIRAVDARYPGSGHDSFIWSISSARQYFLSLYENGERASRLLGDSGYGIEPFLITPYRDPQFNSQQDKFNKAHSSARNIVERVMGVLKSRFRCLKSTLHYKPEKVVSIINICCALHNLCRHFKIDYNEVDLDDISLSSSDNSDEVPASRSTSLQNEGQRIRDEMSNRL